MEIKFELINQPSNSKGWARIKASANGKPVIQSRTGNEYVSATHSADVEPGTRISLTTEVMLRHGKGRTAREEVSSETYTLIAAEDATCQPGSVEQTSGMNGVFTTHTVGGYVRVTGARIAEQGMGA